MVSARPSPATLADAIRVADRSVTILDDKLLVEDGAAYTWLRAHHLRGRGLARYTLGTGPIPANWFRLARRFTTPDEAHRFVATLQAERAVLPTLRTVFAQLNTTTRPADEASMVQVIGDALLCGQAWVLPVRRMPNPFITRTDPAVLASINANAGTQVDFFALAAFEGSQWLRGYVPFKGRTGHVAGQSGMTVATGFDLGQRSRAEISALGFSQEVLEKILPFAGRRMPHYAKAQVVAEVTRLGPVPVLTKAEADACDKAVMSSILSDAKRVWDSTKGRGVPLFVDLPANWQTIWLSRNYQEGPAPHFASAQSFRSAAREGRWQDAIDALRSYTDYRDRVTAEAAILSRQLPPPVAASPTH